MRLQHAEQLLLHRPELPLERIDRQRALVESGLHILTLGRELRLQSRQLLLE